MYRSVSLFLQTAFFCLQWCEGLKNSQVYVIVKALMENEIKRYTIRALPVRKEWRNDQHFT